MTERTQPQTFEEFKGKVADIELEFSQLEGDEDAQQYHISIEALDKEIKGKTGLIHEWIRIPATATDTSIPEDSVLDKYLQQIEMLEPTAKSKPTHKEELQVLIGNSYQFKKRKLGKSYQGHVAKGYFVPVSKIA